MIIRHCIFWKQICHHRLNLFPRTSASILNLNNLEYFHFSSQQNLVSSQRDTDICNLFLSYGFNKAQVKYIISSPHSILNYDEKDLMTNLNIWLEFQINKKLLSTLSRYPELLILSPEYVNNRFKDLMTLFTKKDINKLLITCPKVFLDDFRSVQEKVEYIVNFMGVEQSRIVKTEALQFDLKHILYRHEFMSRSGFYKIKKRVVQAKTPPLNKIFSRNIKTFLSLSGLTNEEYFAFVVAYDFEKELEMDEDSDED